MVTLRWTEKLLRQLPGPITRDPPQSTTLLGDWFCAPLNHRHRRLILSLAERSLLPVVVPAKELATFPARLAEAVLTALKQLGLPEHFREREEAAMNERTLAKTNNRSILGSMNDLRFLALIYLDRYPAAPPEIVAQDLAGVPCGPLEYALPREHTVMLFGAA